MVAVGCAKGGPGLGSDVEDVTDVGGAGGGLSAHPSGGSGNTSAQGGSGSGGSSGEAGGSSATCSDDEQLCGGVCLSLLTDPSNCGDCFHACDPNQECVDGECVGGAGGACDPLAPEAGCGPDGRCRPRPDGIPVCYSPIGSGGQYDPCTDSSHCDAIHECFLIGSSKKCVQWCMADADCPNADDTCHGLAQAIFVGTQAWGVCWNGVL